MLAACERYIILEFIMQYFEIIIFVLTKIYTYF